MPLVLLTIMPEILPVASVQCWDTDGAARCRFKAFKACCIGNSDGTRQNSLKGSTPTLPVEAGEKAAAALCLYHWMRKRRKRRVWGPIGRFSFLDLELRPQLRMFCCLLHADAVRIWYYFCCLWIYCNLVTIKHFMSVT